MIGIVLLSDINYVPYAWNYINSLRKKGIPFKVLMWDRDHSNTKKYPEGIEFITYQKDSPAHSSKIKKIRPFLGFRKFLVKQIRLNKFDKLIFTSTLAAVILPKKLINEYQGRYIFDYRDATYEYLTPFYKRLSFVISKSNFTCISSEGFKELLPQHDYVISHNFNVDLIHKKFSFIKSSGPIKVYFLGLLRETDYMIKNIDLFSLDSRFEFHIFGTGDNEKTISEYIASHGYKNIFFHGRYFSNEKETIVKECDMFLYNYSPSFVNNCALANKYYDGIIFKKPLIGDDKTFSGRLIEKKGVGISISLNDPSFSEKIFSYYMHIDDNTFENNCDDEIIRVNEENNLYLSRIDEFLED